jgi:hypothetical protein
MMPSPKCLQQVLHHRHGGIYLGHVHAMHRRHLSTVAQETQLSIVCADEGMLVMVVKAGIYASGAHIEGCCGFIEVRALCRRGEGLLVIRSVPPSCRDITLIMPNCMDTEQWMDEFGFGSVLETGWDQAGSK